MTAQRSSIPDFNIEQFPQTERRSQEVDNYPQKVNYYDNGNIHSRQIFSSDGQEIRRWVYDQYGKLSSKIEFDKGLLDHAEEYDLDNNTITLKNYSAGKLVEQSNFDLDTKQRLVDQDFIYDHNNILRQLREFNYKEEVYKELDYQPDSANYESTIKKFDPEKASPDQYQIIRKAVISNNKLIELKTYDEQSSLSRHDYYNFEEQLVQSINYYKDRTEYKLYNDQEQLARSYMVFDDGRIADTYWSYNDSKTQAQINRRLQSNQQ